MTGKIWFLLASHGRVLSATRQVVFFITLLQLPWPMTLADTRSAHYFTNQGKSVSNEQEILTPEVGHSIERSMKGGEHHTYRLAFTSGQYMRVSLDQQTIDLIIRVFAPNNQRIVELDSRSRGVESISIVAEASGEYRLEIEPLEKASPAKRYRLRIDELRESRLEDGKRIAAETASTDGKRISATGTPESASQAIKKHLEALSMWRALGDRRGEALSLNNIGGGYAALGEYKKSLEYLDQALPLFKSEGDKPGEAISLFNIALAHSYLGEQQKAVDYLQEAIPIWRSLTDARWEGIALVNLGLIRAESGRKEDAINLYLQALPLLSSEGDRRREAQVLDLIGMNYESLKKYREALDNFAQSARIWHDIASPENEANTLQFMGGTYAKLGESSEALEYFQRSLPLWQAVKDQRREAGTLKLMGSMYSDLGQLDEALSCYNRALLLRQAMHDREGEADMLYYVGVSYSSLMNREQALIYLNRALQVWQSLGNQGGQAQTLFYIGLTYYSDDDDEKALKYFNDALPLFIASGNVEGEINVLNYIGVAYESLNQHQKAIGYIARTVSRWQSIKDKVGEGNALRKLGLIYSFLGDKQNAIKYLGDAIRVIDGVDQPQMKATLFSHIGLVYASIQDYASALNYFNRALEMHKSLGYQSGVYTTLAEIGLVYEFQGDLQKAMDYYKQSIEMREKTRASARLQELQAGLSEQSSNAYERAILLSLRLNRPVDAYDFSERARARSLLDQLGNRRLNDREGASDHKQAHTDSITPSDAKRLEEEIQKENEKLERERVTAIEKGVRPDQVLVDSFEKVPSLNSGQLDELFTLFKGSGNPFSLSFVETVPTLKIPEAQRLLNKDTTLLSYFVTHDKTLAFIITRDSFQVVEISVLEEELGRMIAWFLNISNQKEPSLRVLGQLYTWLIAPVKAHLKTPMVGIAAHGVLHYLPFAALTDGKRFLNDEYLLFHLPSVSALKFIRSSQGSKGARMLALAQNQAEGFRPLEHAEQEVQEIARVYNARVLVGGSATKSKFLAQASNFNILHIAAHGEFNLDSPIFSRIMLAPEEDSDGSLTAFEVQTLNLANTDLVVLSACETQIQPRSRGHSIAALSRGDNILALNRAFISAGASTVVASLWKVDDKATSEFMVSFYRHLKQGMSKASALQAAQRDTRTNNEAEAPYYWAPFVLTGDPGTIARANLRPGARRSVKRP